MNNQINQQIQLASAAIAKLNAQIKDNRAFEPMELTSITIRAYNSREDGPSMTAVANLKMRVFANASVGQDLNRI